MNALPQDNPPQVPQAGGESVAEEYLVRQVREARSALRRTQIGAMVIGLLLIGYFTYVTATLQSALRPQNAAEIANGLIAQRVEEQGPQIAADLKQRVPALIAGLPDYAIREMPGYREALENQIVKDLEGYSTASSKELEENLDTFLTAHKDEIKQVMEDSADPAVVKQLGAELETEFLSHLKETPISHGETLQAKLDKTLEALQAVEKKMARLATAGDLTPQEKKARRAIAILSTRIDRKQMADRKSVV